MTQESTPGTFSIKYHPKWRDVVKYHYTIEDFWHGNDGPWPQPAPENPVGQMAEVIHLPEQEQKDWKRFVGNMYLKRVLTQWPKGLWYALTHNRYDDFDDDRFQRELCTGLYSKFLTPLDEGDLERFKQVLDLGDDEEKYLKADFSCMEPVAPNCLPGMYAAPSITLVQKDLQGCNHQVLAIYLYEVEEIENKKTHGVDYNTIREKIFLPQDGEDWHLAKYFVLQGALHRVNLTEHALLHFPYDPINAITKSILPKKHLLFQLLIPHLYLSLGVNKAVLENPGSLINRKQPKFYSPFCTDGIHVRKLLPDGYIGRGDKKKNAYPAYNIKNFPESKYPPSDYGVYLKAYFEVFEDFVKQVLDHIEDGDEESWNLIALWVACIEEWIPGFPTSEKIAINGKPVVGDDQKGRKKLYKIVTLVMWGLSVAHANDHIAINHKRPHGNPFRLRVPPPTQQPAPAGWRTKLVWRRDLLTSWFTDLLFYIPNNVTRLQDVVYRFQHKDVQTEKELRRLNIEFLQQLQQCEEELERQGVDMIASLDQISASLQY